MCIFLSTEFIIFQNSFGLVDFRFLSFSTLWLLNVLTQALLCRILSNYCFLKIKKGKLIELET